MKEGVYLLHLPGNDYATPVTLRNSEVDGGAILASAQYLQVVANLPEGTELIPMLAVGPIVLDALKVMADQLLYSPRERLQAHRILKDILKELEP